MLLLRQRIVTYPNYWKTDFCQQDKCFVEATLLSAGNVLDYWLSREVLEVHDDRVWNV